MKKYIILADNDNKILSSYNEVGVLVNDISKVPLTSKEMDEDGYVFEVLEEIPPKKEDVIGEILA